MTSTQPLNVIQQGYIKLQYTSKQILCSLLQDYMIHTVINTIIYYPESLNISGRNANYIMQ